MPEAHIQIFVMKTGDEEWVVAAFRTDGYHHWNGTLIPVVEHLARDFQLASEVDVDDLIVEFAVESERQRQESIGDIAAILEAAVNESDKEGSFRAFAALMEEEVLEENSELEQRVGKALDEIFTRTGGLT